MAARRLGNLFLFLGLATFAACEEQELTTTGIVHPTLIEVSPSDFLGDVPCGVGPGSAQVYVATLHDYGPAPFEAGDAGVAAAGAGGEGGAASAPTGCAAITTGAIGFAKRSNPVSCGTAVGFARVSPDHCYSVDIEMFDRSDLVVHELHEVKPEEVEPMPPPDVRDVATGELVAPRWSTSCGRATARSAVVRRIRSCEPLVDHKPSAATTVELRPDLTLGDRSCGTGSTDVDRFEVTTPSGTQTLACGEPLVLADAVVGRTVVLGVLAFARGDAAPVLGTTCTAVPRTGVAVSATCLPFTGEGALEIDPNAAASALGLECSALRELALTAPGASPLRVRPSACGTLVPIAGLSRGDQAIAVLASPSDGSPEVAGTCSATVVPGRRVLATCAPEP